MVTKLIEFRGEMMGVSFLENLRQKTELEFNVLKFRIDNFGKQNFKCPICGYYGPFRDLSMPTGSVAKHERCIRCRSWTRHRLQQLVLNELFKDYDISTKKILHFAPEKFFKKNFQRLFQDYISADIQMEGVDVKCDMTNLPFEDAEFDFVCACHVLEHIKDDYKALSEIRRVLKPHGIAILPVPILGKKTIEYPEPNPNEWDHVRCPGEDYYDRYLKFFSTVKTYSSTDFSDINQIYIYEDRTVWPNEPCPLRPPTEGEKHIDIIPVCYV
ncbi:class I SAM-dependent methyltransferase [Microcoleus sp. MOSTC5]|uniref:class I SAM-dependent methyltransferase n=1 Tax=Microcoleus sp. MOSTC5 TaxID=3055378 RepID=UPI002FD4F5B5